MAKAKLWLKAAWLPVVAALTLITLWSFVSDSAIHDHDLRSIVSIVIGMLLGQPTMAWTYYRHERKL